MARQQKSRNSGLNEKQELFIYHYLQTFNITVSAELAGYSVKTAAVQGQRLLKNAKVNERIEREMKRLRERMKEDANRIYAQLWMELDEINEKLQLHRDAEKELKCVEKELNEIKQKHIINNASELIECVETGEMSGEEANKFQRLEMQKRYIIQSPDYLGDVNWRKLQTLKAGLLHDLFDRAGYKATDKIDINASVSGKVDLSYMSDDDIQKEIERLEQ